MTFNTEDHIDNLVRHITLVREACLILGKRLIRQGRHDFGRILIARGFEHDVSKFSGIEWQYLHAGPNVDEDNLRLAIEQHVRTNSHHPEYWGGFDNMPEIAVAEMVCDWYARSQEFGTGLRDWITSNAIQRFNIDIKGERFHWVTEFVDTLLESSFVRDE